MFLSAALVTILLGQPAAPKPFEFKDGDHIVWLGSTLVEREQRYGYWEAALIAANPDKKLTLRNLGWSGDTVHGEARGRFDFPDANKCFKQIVDPTLELKPTIIFISYGTNESFEGKEGLPKFEKGLEKLLDALKPANARIVLFSPLPFQRANGGVDADARNKVLILYRDAIEKIARARGHEFADLFGRVNIVAVPISENGMHLTESGYRAAAVPFLNALGLSAKQADPEKLEPLRQAVIAKNEQFFNKWRPQNETYLFGFRKHEQGKNAKEIAEFDPFIAKAEEEIERQKQLLKK